MKDILIVEDGPKERERLHGLFTKAGYSVTACESVGEAESFLEHNRVRLAILDIGLGDKSGSHLFNTIRRGRKAEYVIIFTGNPSVHLKQRFIDEGAIDYIVKGAPAAQNDKFMQRVKEIIGEPQGDSEKGIGLEEFISKYVDQKSQKLFYTADNTFPECKSCGASSYQVIFSHTAQMPPEVTGKVVCVGCDTEMDPEIA